MTVTEWLSEVVLYGGIPVRRIDVERHLDSLGCEGPARLVYGDLPAVDMEPEEYFDTGAEEFVSC